MLTDQSTESLSLRDFWHFGCGAASDARSKPGYLTGDEKKIGTISPFEAYFRSCLLLR